jgi:hypothetical protein
MFFTGEKAEHTPNGGFLGRTNSARPLMLLVIKI